MHGQKNIKLHRKKFLRQVGHLPRNALMITLNLLTTTIVAPPGNASKWHMGFNSAFKGLMTSEVSKTILSCLILY